MYSELQQLVHRCGGLLSFLPPYSPQLNPIEIGFSLLKRWLKRHASLAFRFDTKRTLNVAMVECTKASEDVGSNLYRLCGYCFTELNRDTFFYN
jgi:hypothetical protein